MLYMARKHFDIATDVSATPEDIVDVSTWEPGRVKAMVENGFLMETQAKVATVIVESPKATESARTPADKNSSGTHRRVSPLTSRYNHRRIFKQMLAAKQGE